MTFMIRWGGFGNGSNENQIVEAMKREMDIALVTLQRNRHVRTETTP